ncbi:PH domain-containing protein [Patescibacteria group bacterium]|nr:PH domain-containing protein [Patescibacteria group bacterium]MDE1946907.1 PH domain-containing protein [Patescibacteria group bacterium]MDE2011108.1 PH domain-containing protein [Patescibacteria group bacterium]MDE2233200.1 PH domain-containing protein [Patescibacteria group bacterium]
MLFILANGNQKTDIGIILGFAIIGGLILYLVMILPYAWYVKAYIRRYYYAGEEHFITIKKGVFAPAEIHVQWQKIQDVYVDQDVVDRMMGLYDVHVASATAASGIEAHIDGVDQAAAEGLKQFLLNKVSSAGRGGFQNAVPVTPEQAQEQPHPQSTSINLTEEVSSNTYPLTGKWLAVKLVSRLVGPFIYWGFIIFIIFGRAFSDIPYDYYGPIFLGYLAVSILSAIIYAITLFIWKKNYAFNFTQDNIYYREGVISLSEKHMPYASIQDVTVQQSVLERLVGLARVCIENAAQQNMRTYRGVVSVFTGVMLQGISVNDANKITNLLKTTVLGKNTSRYGL